MPTYKSITEDYGNKTIENYILDKIQLYIRKELETIIRELKLYEKRKTKQVTYLVALRIVSNHLSDLDKSEEFQKAHIKVKAIRINNGGKILSICHLQHLSIQKLLKKFGKPQL